MIRQKKNWHWPQPITQSFPSWQKCLKTVLMKTLLRFFIVIIALWVLGFLGFVLWQQTTHVQDPLRKTDAVLVLTGGTNRITSGLFLMAAGSADHMMISGVAPGTTLERLLTDNNMPVEIQAVLKNHCCITLGEMATNTIQNAQETAPWIDGNNIQSVRLVTSVYHIPRALWHLKHHVNNDVDWVLHPVRPNNSSLWNLSSWEVMLREYAKLTVALPLSLYVLP